MENFTKTTNDRGSILFLLRTYNDIDHIVPVIWKVTASDLQAYYIFVGDRYPNDYRIKFITANGAVEIKSRFIRRYYESVRKFIVPRIARRFVDRVIANTVGLTILKIYRVGVVVNEWSGPFGRLMAECYLWPASWINLPVYSLPHGYHTWRNNLFNAVLIKHWDDHGALPDFSNRSWFTRYVIQDENVKRYYLAHGMGENNLIILGSARFCEEWSAINLDLLENLYNSEMEFVGNGRFTVLFILPHWDYNVNRSKTVDLLLRISNAEGVDVVIKPHTRGTGGVSEKEARAFRETGAIDLAGEGTHSPSLIKRADVVINLGSSIGFEVLRQGKPLCNPIYLHGNSTIFDNSGVVFDANSEGEVVTFLKHVKGGRFNYPSRETLSKFFNEFVLGGRGKPDVLTEYISLLTEEVGSRGVMGPTT